MDVVLEHDGTKFHSGRYPWGSGANPEQRNRTFLGYVNQLSKEGLSDKEIADGLKMTVAKLKARKTVAIAANRAALALQAQKFKDKGMSNVAIGKRMGGLNESSVRGLLSPTLQLRSQITASVASVLRDAVDKKRYVDIGEGVEPYLGVARTKLKASIALLEDEGYEVHFQKVKQPGGKNTSLMILAAPGVTSKEIYQAVRDNKIGMVTGHSEDGGETFIPLRPPVNLSSKRIAIRYKEQGGELKDGVIEVRRGVEDLSLNGKNYAQARVAVDGTHYLKGMVIYGDKFPPGIDVIYNTNKPKGTPPTKVFKPMEKDPENPFGSSVVQRFYKDAQGKEQQSALNIIGSRDHINEEGRWTEWKRTISSQVLSKQSPSLAKKQLDLSYEIKKQEFDDINALTNPVVKQLLLKKFSDGCDSDAKHLKAAALPGQSSSVLIPILSMKENEIFAPRYNNGDRVVLIRHPHGGIFEIPELTVNNKNPEARRIMPDAEDGVGIHPSVAAKLSGADFDGDSVLVIPNRNKDIKTKGSLEQLKNFNPREAYPKYEGMPKMSEETKQLEMGKISNLITDMTIQGASDDKIARAVKHSMVVIDAEKHELNYRLSAKENDIAALKREYQGGSISGAATLISKAKSLEIVPHRKDRVRIDPVSGKKIYTDSGEVYPVKIEKTNRKGEVRVIEKIVPRLTKSTKMDEADNAFDLSSGTRIETVYANHANKLKSLGNTARKTMIGIKPIPASHSAKETYAKEVEILKARVNLAYRNKPLERQALLVANNEIRTKRDNNPHLKKDALRKMKGMAFEKARIRLGAKKQKIEIDDRMWEAIQMGAVTTNLLKKVLDNADLDQIKERAMPRASREKLTIGKANRAKQMLALGYTHLEVANALGVSQNMIRDID